MRETMAHVALLRLLTRGGKQDTTITPPAPFRPAAPSLAARQSARGAHARAAGRALPTAAQRQSRRKRACREVHRGRPAAPRRPPPSSHRGAHCGTHSEVKVKGAAPAAGLEAAAKTPAAAAAAARTLAAAATAAPVSTTAAGGDSAAISSSSTAGGGAAQGGREGARGVFRRRAALVMRLQPGAAQPVVLLEDDDAEEVDGAPQRQPRTLPQEQQQQPRSVGPLGSPSAAPPAAAPAAGAVLDGAAWAAVAQRVTDGSAEVVLLRNWVAASGLLSDCFSSAALAASGGEQEIELREQYLRQGRKDGERNYDSRGQTWVCRSYTKHMLLKDYLRYRSAYRQRAQRNYICVRWRWRWRWRGSGSGRGSGRISRAHSKGIHSPHPDPPPPPYPYPQLLFGTNVDLTGPRWRAQLLALERSVPAFMSWKGPGTLLSRLGHTIQGMSGVQLYLKVPGCRTPGHQENNCFASVNINLGPGSCVWYTVDGKHRDVVDALCRRKAKCNMESGAWWPIYEDLLAAGVDVRRFEQHVGDAVIVNPSCIHWVQVGTGKEDPGRPAGALVFALGVGLVQ